MYHGPIGIGTGLLTTGITAAVFLPKSRSFHLMFFVAGIALLIGVITLLSTTLISIRSRSNKR